MSTHARERMHVEILVHVQCTRHQLKKARKESAVSVRQNRNSSQHELNSGIRAAETHYYRDAVDGQATHFMEQYMEALAHELRETGAK